MPGFAKRPPELHVIQGTFRKDRLGPGAGAYPLAADVPYPPAWLRDKHARDEWHRLAPILHSCRVLTEPALVPLAHLCALHGQLASCWESGVLPTGAHLSAYRLLMNDFGLSPTAQQRVKPAEGGADVPGNRFAGKGNGPPNAS